MKFLCAVIAISFLLTASTSVAHADRTAKVKHQLTADYTLISKYFEQKNINGIAGMTAPNYLALAPGQPPVTKQSMLIDFKEQMAMLSNAVWIRKILRLTVTSNTATVLVTGHMTATTVDRSGKTHAFVLNAISIDQWVPVGTNWEVLHSQVMRVQAFMDGRLMQEH